MSPEKVHEIVVNEVVAEITKELSDKGIANYKVQIYKPKHLPIKQNFERDELLDVAQVADQAHTWIHNKMFLRNPKKDALQLDHN